MKRDKTLWGMRKAFSCEPHEHLGGGLYHCPSLSLWWKNGVTYDELSASHNGIIGMGAQIKQMIRSHNV